MASYGVMENRPGDCERGWPTPERTAISPEHSYEEWVQDQSFEKMVETFHARVLGWQLRIAWELRGHPHAGLAMLSIVMSYFETIGKARAGYVASDRSSYYFGQGLGNVFTVLERDHAEYVDAIVKALYSQVRCGMYHEGITGRQVAISEAFTEPLAVRGPAPGIVEQVHVNATLLVEALMQQLDAFAVELRNPENVQLRVKFERWFLKQHGEAGNTKGDNQVS
jgi:hypothetical protein